MTVQNKPVTRVAGSLKPPQKDSGKPRFGLLLLVLIAVILALGVLTWVMSSLYQS